MSLLILGEIILFSEFRPVLPCHLTKLTHKKSKKEKKKKKSYLFSSLTIHPPSTA